MSVLVLPGGYKLPRYNLCADAAPTANDDVNDGYCQGSVWVRKGVGIWLCRKADAGQAEWVQVSSGSLTVKEFDGDPTYTGVSVIECKYMSVAPGIPGIGSGPSSTVIVTPQDASLDQPGIVSTTSQNFRGDKYVAGVLGVTVDVGDLGQLMYFELGQEGDEDRTGCYVYGTSGRIVYRDGPEIEAIRLILHTHNESGSYQDLALLESQHGSEFQIFHSPAFGVRVSDSDLRRGVYGTLADGSVVSGGLITEIGDVCGGGGFTGTHNGMVYFNGLACGPEGSDSGSDGTTTTTTTEAPTTTTTTTTTTAAPTTRIHDKFDVSDQTNAGRTPDTTNVPGNTWSNALGTASVVSNTLRATSYDTSLGASIVRTVIDNGQRAAHITADMYLGDSGLNGGLVDIFFRYADASNFWVVRISKNIGADNLIQIGEMSGGSYSVRSSVSCTINFSAVYSLTLTDDGTAIAATIGGNTANYSSTSGNANTLVGVQFYSGDGGYYGSYVDKFVVVS